MKEIHSFSPSFNLRRATWNPIIADARLGTLTSFKHLFFVGRINSTQWNISAGRNVELKRIIMNIHFVTLFYTSKLWDAFCFPIKWRILLQSWRGKLWDLQKMSYFGGKMWNAIRKWEMSVWQHKIYKRKYDLAQWVEILFEVEFLFSYTFIDKISMIMKQFETWAIKDK